MIGKDEIESLTTKTFDEYVKNNYVVIVDFWAPWCMPCQMQGKQIIGKMSDLPKGVKMVKVNVDENPALAQRFNVKGIPQLYLFVNGKVMEGWTGLTKPETLFNRAKDFVI